jgi:hypothetical protein
MGKVQDQQQRLAEAQITKIEATLSDGHKFKRRGNGVPVKNTYINHFPAITSEPWENSFILPSSFNFFFI